MWEREKEAMTAVRDEATGKLKATGRPLRFVQS